MTLTLTPRHMIVVLLLIAGYFVGQQDGGQIFGPKIDKDDRHVLILEETSKRYSLPPSQLAVITGGASHKYLEEFAPQRWRVLDKDASLTAVEDIWKTLAEVDSSEIPRIIVGDGDTNEAAPLPQSPDELREFLSKYE